ncbi:hotdog fold thioesterase [Oceanobacillus piezotolerans]|uniref:Hotdog fold thioesterase n=1 Tax=Oceanobacillus piezotolerans TaxID=2448030 RepID=A0A498D7H5_9BACI|nr:hotdog fold thioesterase [Oceanobacillus piezotolerans]RLL46476.1 hotdog fold thioesterase [Oceanobacillus piezotolerans]
MDVDNSLLQTLGIEIVTLNKDDVILSMPVDERTRQPFGYLHGGASVALAETAASLGAAMHTNLETNNVFGIEINANHIKSKKDGIVTASALPIHIGKSSMVWEVKITDERNQLICISRCTIAVVPKK